MQKTMTYTDPDTGEENEYEIEEGEYLNPFNGFVYSDLDEYLTDLSEMLLGRVSEVCDSDVRNWLVWGDAFGGCPYFDEETRQTTDAYNDYKRGYENEAYIFSLPDGRFWGFEWREGQTEWVQDECLQVSFIEIKTTSVYAWKGKKGQTICAV